MPNPKPAPPRPRASRRLPDSVRRRVEVATAMAWETLVDAHARHALQFVELFADRMSFTESVGRYLRELAVADSMAVAIRTRVLVSLEDGGPLPDAPALVSALDADDLDEADGWRRFRPDVLVRGVVERSRRNEVVERWVQLAIARAEEGLILTHIDNALTFAALLDPHMTLDRAVQEYIGTMNLMGGRAQAVFQRTMARLAEVHLPDTGPGLPEPAE